MSNVCFVDNRKYNTEEFWRIYVVDCNKIWSKFENYDIYNLTNEQKKIIAEIL
jgi:hypothetical protein